MNIISSSKWWVLLLIGIVLAFIGIYMIASPKMALVSIVQYLGAIFLIFGAVIAIANYRSMKQWPSGFWFGGGIFNLVIGMVLLFFPAFSVKIFVVLIGIFGILTGLFFFFFFQSNKDLILNRWFYLVNSAVPFILGIILIFNPFRSAAVLTVLIGILVLAIGVMAIFTSLRMRKLN